MKRLRKTYALVGGSLFMYMVTMWLMGSVLKITGRQLWIFWIGMWALGIIAAVLVLWFFGGDTGGDAATEGNDADIGGAIALGKRRLARARAGKVSFGKLPGVLVFGPVGSTKTTAVIQSGLDPELLAGEVYRGDTVCATAGINLWYSQGTVFVEAGGTLIRDPGQWQRLLRFLRPDRMAAVFTGTGQAPRQAVVCVSCEDLVKPGNSESVPAMARELRERLAEASQKLGIRLPVYVVFTKADRIPYFTEYVKNLSNEEAQQHVLGTTLRVADEVKVSSHAQFESQRLTQAFDALYTSLSQWRLPVLERESTGTAQARAASYEFPREFRKIQNLMIQFLVELCKPSQLQVSPFLRGFYFTGVRPIIVSDVVAAAAQPQAAAARRVDATQVFDPGQAAPVPAPAAGGARSRKVPQWTFLERVFGDVIMRDRVAMTITQGGARVNLLRRMLLGSAASVAVILLIGLNVSYIANRRLVRAARNSAVGLPGLVSNAPDLPSLATLTTLDSARTQLERLYDYGQDGPPLRLRWGLYRGRLVYPELRTIYVDAFRRVLLARAQQGIYNSLASLPALPNEASEYGETYNWLKAYLMLTSHPDRMDGAFLTPVLVNEWSANRQVDVDRLELARRQFAFYAGKLCADGTCGSIPDDGLVSTSRRFLLQFGDIDRVYQVMLASVGTASAPVQFGDSFPDASSVLRNAYVVPAAFTAVGWETIHASLRDGNQLFAAEDWVLGDQASTERDRARMVAELRRTYVDDYRRHWRAFMEAGRVERYRNLRDAAAKLTRFSSPDSPLLQMLALASRNTVVDSQTVTPTFQPVHEVTPPDADLPVNDANRPYIDALIGLQAAVDAAAGASGTQGQSAVADATAQAAAAKAAVSRLAQSFNIEGDARIVGASVQKLMRDVITNAEAHLRSFGPNTINTAGRGFCSEVRGTLRKFPFTNSGTEATLDEVAGLLRRPGGRVWGFFEETIQEHVSLQGGRYVRRPGASVQVTNNLLEFLNRAAAIADVLYSRPDQDRPRVAFELTPQLSGDFPSVTININGNERRTTQTDRRGIRGVWSGGDSEGLTVSRLIGGQTDQLFSDRGPWAIFKFLRQATWTPISSGQYRLSWNFPGRDVPFVAELSVSGGAPVFQPNYMTGLDCPSQMAR